LRRAGGKLSLWEATAIAVGIIIGASIFSLIGVGAEIAGRDLPLAFVFASTAALLVAYNYARLGSKIVSNAGPIEFILRGIGDNVLTGMFAFMLWFTYVASIALFAKTFAGYFLALIHAPLNALNTALVEVAVVAVFVALNFRGSKTVGRAESLIVAAKLGILSFFIAIGLWTIKPSLLAPVLDKQHLAGVAYAAAFFFLSYTGFGLVTNASEDIEDPERNVPRAIYLSLLISTLVYIGVSVVAIGNLPVEKLVKAKEYALAEAAKPFLGEAGFTLIALGALLSTSSAINATLYGGANIAYALAREGELPRAFERKAWFGAPEGLYITAGLGLALALFLNLDGVAAVCSATFIIIYLAVIVSHYRLRHITRGNAAIIAASFVVVAAILVLLLYHQYVTSPRSFYTIIASYAGALIVEYIYRARTGRTIKKRLLYTPASVSAA